jgi:hypothetical protein
MSSQAGIKVKIIEVQRFPSIMTTLKLSSHIATLGYNDTIAIAMPETFLVQVGDTLILYQKHAALLRDGQPRQLYWLWDDILRETEKGKDTFETPRVEFNFTPPADFDRGEIYSNLIRRYFSENPRNWGVFYGQRATWDDAPKTPPSETEDK